jgi:hypothetical protein
MMVHIEILAARRKQLMQHTSCVDLYIRFDLQGKQQYSSSTITSKFNFKRFITS